MTFELRRYVRPITARNLSLTSISDVIWYIVEQEDSSNVWKGQTGEGPKPLGAEHEKGRNRWQPTEEIRAKLCNGIS